LFIAMGLSVLFIYMVLASQFDSFWQPLVIMTAIPFSFVGAFLALRLLDLDLDITGMIGLILLLGLVVKNSLLLVDFTNRLRGKERERDEALARAGAVRLRPIMMTALSLIAGNLPIAIGLGEGAEVRRGLSVVVIGGMVSATLLTLLIVPTFYSLIDGALQRLGRMFGSSSEEQEPPEDTPHAPAEQPASPAAAHRQQAGAE
jgi:HAE1 family hydrophobic/amphiphilic exporter-1